MAGFVALLSNPLFADDLSEDYDLNDVAAELRNPVLVFGRNPLLEDTKLAAGIIASYRDSILRFPDKVDCEAIPESNARADSSLLDWSKFETETDIEVCMSRLVEEFASLQDVSDWLVNEGAKSVYTFELDAIVMAAFGSSDDGVQITSSWPKEVISRFRPDFVSNQPYARASGFSLFLFFDKDLRLLNSDIGFIIN
jgi:hypothetical protein